MFHLHGKRNVECRNILYALFFVQFFLRKECKNMTICRDCNILIQPVIPLSNDKHNKFCRCPKCYSATKHQIIRCGELVFGELLEKEIHKRK